MKNPTDKQIVEIYRNNPKWHGMPICVAKSGIIREFLERKANAPGGKKY